MLINNTSPLHVDLISQSGVWVWTWELKHKANEIIGVCVPSAGQGVSVSKFFQGFDFVCQYEPTGLIIHPHVSEWRHMEILYWLRLLRMFLCCGKMKWLVLGILVFNCSKEQNNISSTAVYCIFMQYYFKVRTSTTILRLFLWYCF